MVNPDSDLYRQHPEWAMQFPNREHTEERNQLMLNLARPDVKEWMFNWLDKLVSENDIAFSEVGLQPRLVRTRMEYRTGFITGTSQHRRREGNLRSVRAQPL